MCKVQVNVSKWEWNCIKKAAQAPLLFKNNRKRQTLNQKQVLGSFWFFKDRIDLNQ